MYPMVPICFSRGYKDYNTIEHRVLNPGLGRVHSVLFRVLDPQGLGTPTSARSMVKFQEENSNVIYAFT